MGDNFSKLSCISLTDADAHKIDYHDDENKLLFTSCIQIPNNESVKNFIKNRIKLQWIFRNIVMVKFKFIERESMFILIDIDG